MKHWASNYLKWILKPNSLQTIQIHIIVVHKMLTTAIWELWARAHIQNPSFHLISFNNEKSTFTFPGAIGCGGGRVSLPACNILLTWCTLQFEPHLKMDEFNFISANWALGSVLFGSKVNVWWCVPFSNSLCEHWIQQQRQYVYRDNYFIINIILWFIFPKTEEKNS